MTLTRFASSRPAGAGFIAIAALLLAGSSVAHADPATKPSDFQIKARAAGDALSRVLPQCSKMIDDGDLAGSIARLLATYPEATRTPAQSFVLGNALFEIDRKISYSLHKTAFTAEPTNAMVLWEWAVEQHRAGEYEAALATYQAYAKLNPRRAASYALQADCLLRLNRIDDATVAWRQSELAPEGSIEGMENLVCSIHRDPIPYARRDELLKTAEQNQDAGAAADLIALDCDFPRDWWNGGPEPSYLAHDLSAVMKALKLPADDVQGRAIAGAAEIAQSDRHDAAAIKAILVRHRLIIDPD